MKTEKEMLEFYKNLQSRFPKLTLQGAVLRVQYQFNIPQSRAIALVTGQPYVTEVDKVQKFKEVRARAESNPYLLGINTVVTKPFISSTKAVRRSVKAMVPRSSRGR